MEPAPHPLEELVVSNMWGLAALVEVLARKGILSQQEILEALAALRTRDGGVQEEGRAAGRDPMAARRRDGADPRSHAPGLRSV